MPLSRNDRRLARSIARHAWIQSGNDIETADVIFRGNSKLVGLDPATILLLVQIAIKLWQLWIAKKHDHPSAVASYDELRLMEVDEDAFGDDGDE
jgi:hypothetical protein